MVILVLLAVAGACTRDPNKRKANYLAKGESFFNQGKYQEASIEFRKALKVDPKFTPQSRGAASRLNYFPPPRKGTETV